MGKNSGGGGGGSQTVTQKADPWAGIQPYLTGGSDITGLYPEAHAWYGSPAPQYFPGPTIAGRSGETEEAFARQAARASSGNPLIPNAQSQAYGTARGDYLDASPANPYLSFTAGGGYLNSNPWLDSMYGAAANNVTQNYRNAVAPSIASMFSAAGRYGNNAAMTNAFDTAERGLGTTLRDLGSNLYGQNYGQERALQSSAAGQLGRDYLTERGYQMGALGLAPQLANQDYYDIGQLRDLGSQREARRQQVMNEMINRWNFDQNKPLDKLQQYGTLLQGGMNLGGQKTSEQPIYGSGAGSALGGALTGYGLGSMLGGSNLGYNMIAGIPGLEYSMFGPIGAGLGILGSLWR